MDRFIQYNVRINDEKCKFGVNRINCLGFVLDTNGLKPDPERLAPLLRAKSPSNVNQLRSVNGPYTVLFKVLFKAHYLKYFECGVYMD